MVPVKEKLALLASAGLSDEEQGRVLAGLSDSDWVVLTEIQNKDIAKAFSLQKLKLAEREPWSGARAAGNASVYAAPRFPAEPSIDPARERVLSSLRALAARYMEVQMDRFLDGREDLLRVGLSDLSPVVPPGLRTDVLFRDVYAGVLGIVRAGHHRGAAIFTGTPGMGKSSVAIILACELASKRMRFVHRSTAAGIGEIWVYMDFSKADSFEVDYALGDDSKDVARVTGHLQNPLVMLIWDGRMNKGQYRGERPYVVLSSTNEGGFEHFSRGGVPIYCIDTWSLREILRARELFPGVTHDMAVQRYREHGGSVREVLANALLPDQSFHVSVDNTTSDDDLDCLCTLQFQGSSGDVKHCFAHMRAGPDMLFSKFVIASPAVRQLVYRQHVELKKWSVRQLVLSDAAGKWTYRSGFRGCMLEEVGHEVLAGTVTVTVKPCKPPTIKDATHAARAAAKKAVIGLEAYVGDALKQDSSTSPGIAAMAELRRSKRLRAAPSSNHAREMQDMVQEMVEEMVAELEDHHALPPPGPPLEGEEPAVAEKNVLQQLTGWERQVQLTGVPRVWDYPGLDIRGMPAYYLQPTTVSNGGWDAVRKCPQHVWILQYTISEWHGTRAQSVLDLLNRFSAEDRHRAIMVYAVPDDVYLGYLKQPWVTVGRKHMREVPAELQRIPQLVLKMPLKRADSRNRSCSGTAPSS